MAFACLAMMRFYTHSCCNTIQISFATSREEPPMQVDTRSFMSGTSWWTARADKLSVASAIFCSYLIIINIMLETVNMKMLFWIVTPKDDPHRSTLIIKHQWDGKSLQTKSLWAKMYKSMLLFFFSFKKMRTWVFSDITENLRQQFYFINHLHMF